MLRKYLFVVKQFLLLIGILTIQVKSDEYIASAGICGRWETKEKINSELMTGSELRTPVSGCQWLGYNRVHIRESRTYKVSPKKKLEFMRYEYNSTSGCELENYSRQIIGYGDWDVNKYTRGNQTLVDVRINWRKVIIRSRMNHVNILDDLRKINWLYKSLEPVYFYDLNLINTCIEHLTIIPDYDISAIDSKTIKIDGENIKISNEKLNIDHIPDSKVEEALLRMVTGYSGNVISDMVKKEFSIEKDWEEFFKRKSPRMRKICQWNDIKEFCLMPPSEIIHKHSCKLPSVDHLISSDLETLKVALYPYNSTLPETDLIEFSKYKAC
ncbi:Uncharacterized protein cmbei_300915 [Cryptosporidium meleagridis]